MTQYTFNAWLLGDFSGSFGTNTDTVGGGFTGNTTLSSGATQVSFTLEDDVTDLNFEDSSAGEGGANLQTLVTPITIGGFTYPAGATVQLEYVPNISDGSEMLVVRIGRTSPGNAVDGDNVLVIYPEGVPGTTYNVTSISDTQSRPYASICFGRGTLVFTADGPRKVEDINVGDMIPNKSGEIVAVRWIGKMHLSEAALMENPSLRPVVISKNALGDNSPNSDLTVSPQHRIFIDNWRAEIMFGFSEFLTPAKSLINDSTIRSIHPTGGIEYFHIMFDKHEIINANGQWTESFYTGNQAIDSLEQESKIELFKIFPELAHAEPVNPMVLAAPCLKPFEVQALNAY